ncbi:MAG: SDR family NAD(P)-dependent oxidoreductase [Steroidobacteraceae bacterium]
MTGHANPFRLDDKVALVSGAAQGIGAAIAVAFAHAGARVLVADIQETAGLAIVGKIERSGGQAQFQRHAVVSEPEWQAAVA